MKTIILATGNGHKLIEFKQIMTDYEFLSLKDIGFDEDIEETGDTLKENSKIKVDAVYQFCKDKGLNYPVIGDDSGLFINALGGDPGVHSARYAGDHEPSKDRAKVLFSLKDKEDRSAYMECTICYYDGNEYQFFVGQTHGTIATEELGDTSFGYDCLFMSDDLGKTFGQAESDEKNSISHRSRAIKQLNDWLNSKK